MLLFQPAEYASIPADANIRGELGLPFWYSATKDRMPDPSAARRDFIDVVKQVGGILVHSEGAGARELILAVATG
jgi:hypothetical protein